MNPSEGNVSDGNHSSYSLCNKAIPGRLHRITTNLNKFEQILNWNKILFL
ncbi:hypothetical protein NEIFLAOT_01322 [Neisseria flavescens NRL30031/H210]|uniref:Uncharacterized protein n=1 Tax=Neisseria flavescens NRL30031/H210 TaxID=546264 RepID=C0EMZ2_NEIFL|nr:hypothetical protein NEIFLAOT_01322 [Neisseria flavescens NRL30031/H210]